MCKFRTEAGRELYEDIVDLKERTNQLIELRNRIVLARKKGESADEDIKELNDLLRT